jgi:hypothetical protein
MTFSDAIAQLEELDDEDMILAERERGEWRPDSAVVIRSPIDAADPYPIKVGNADFFLDVSLAREIIEDWTVATKRRSVPIEEQVRLLIHYVNYDAAPQVGVSF